MTYTEAIEFLSGLRVFAATFGLENTRRLAALAGNPERRLRFIHVAGTNGKGSTCALLESIYRAAGLRTGLFTSPHLVSFRERIQVNRELIPEADLARIATDLRARNGGEGITLFEFTTVLALVWFAEQNCDLVIWETGLGGRLDATNIVTPLASVITNIAFDHEQWLGDTLAKIAGEKAGIIKPGIPVVTATDAPEARAVIAAAAQKMGAPLTVVDTEIQNRPGSAPAPGAVFRAPAENFGRTNMSVAGADTTAEQEPDARARPATPGAGVPPSREIQFHPLPCPVPLIGAHQQINAALALATVEVLQSRLPVTPEQLRAGLASVRWAGRLQRLTRPGSGELLLDGAHNPAGATALRRALETELAGRQLVLIFGSLNDKNWPVICQILAPLAGRIITVPVASKRTADAREVAAAFRAARPDADVTVCAGLAEALNASKDAGFIVITGSLYLIGEALDRLGPSPAGAGERGLNEWSGGAKLA